MIIIDIIISLCNGIIVQFKCHRNKGQGNNPVTKTESPLGGSIISLVDFFFKIYIFFFLSFSQVHLLSSHMPTYTLTSVLWQVMHGENINNNIM